MHRKKERFLEILEMELEDLILDLQDRIDLYVRGNEAGRVTNYVMKENVAVLENEISGVRHLLESLRNVEPDDAESFTELMRRVQAGCRRVIEEAHFPEALCDMLERKCAKVQRYVME